jgi:hypothetical protein
MTAVSASRPRMPSWTRPTRLSSAVFAAKVAAFRARRALHDLADGPPRLSRAEASGFPLEAGAVITPLWSDANPAERAWQLGKVENLRLACRALDGRMIPAGTVFSFWRHVGPPFAARGFVRGRMLQQGCMVPAVGGGLCQVSNALYDAALQAGCHIVERHPHSRIVPGSAAAWGRDATVAWNYVDLRFRADQDLRLDARLTRDGLQVRLTARPDAAPAPAADPEATPPPGAAARDCATCDETECFLHEHGERAAPALPGRRVFLVDEAWPEFQGHIAAAHTGGDAIGMPLDGARLGLARYAWPAAGFERTASAPVAALRRTLAQRAAGVQGAARRSAELEAAERIAAVLARRLLRLDVTAVTVAQSYLPFLQRGGWLGGRAVSVLMTRLPMGVLQARLNAAASRHADWGSLSDFRAPSWLVEAEAEALAAADRIITPHAEIAGLFGDRAVRLPWAVPPAGDRAEAVAGRIAFPGPTIARKGAFALRDAARALDLEVIPLGAELEGDRFWDGVRTIQADWRTAAAMVQPALVEDQPRRLLAALAAGMPVIATPACGLEPRPGLTLVEADDAEALAGALRAVVG